LRNKHNTDPIYLKLFDIEPSKKDLKKIEIVLAAIESIADVGLELTTFDSIAKRLKTGPSHIAYYFPNKVDIIDSAIKFALGTAQDITVRNIKRVKSSKSRIETIVRSTFEWARRYPKHVLIFILFQHLCTFEKEKRELHSQIRKVGRDRMIQVLKESEQKTPSSKKDLERLAHEIQNLTLGNLFECFVINSPFTLRAQEEATVKQVLKILTDV
jgi:AcrR family transcriptional regulator